MIALTEELGQQIGLRTACQSLNVPRSQVYRARQPQGEPKARPKPSRALTEAEQVHIRDVLNSDRFQDCAPRQVYATLLDEQCYLCHWRTMYRILAAHQEVRERRSQRRQPTYIKPELLATGPNQVWSWDITQLKSLAKWQPFYLYVIIDIFSRYVVGWLIADREAGELAQKLIAESCAKHNIQPEQLTLHSDRGSPMKSEPVVQLLYDLGIEKSLSRPHVSDDNPFSEAQFKTLKYRPDYPGRFATIDQARQWARAVFTWYNQQHYHSALGLLTPASLHFGQAETIVAGRQQVLKAAYEAHPDRFVKGSPLVHQPPKEVWINPPKSDINSLH
jgi:putative transposase